MNLFEELNKVNSEIIEKKKINSRRRNFIKKFIIIKSKNKWGKKRME